MSESDKKHITSALQNIISAILGARHGVMPGEHVKIVRIESLPEFIERARRFDAIDGLTNTWPGVRTQVIYATWEARERKVPFEDVELET